MPNNQYFQTMFSGTALTTSRFLAAQPWYGSLARSLQTQLGEQVVCSLFWNRTRKLNLSQDELANLVGISRQTANRALNALAQRGLVTLEFGRLNIADDDALTRFIFSAPEEPPGLPAT